MELGWRVEQYCWYWRSHKGGGKELILGARLAGRAVLLAPEELQGRQEGERKVKDINLLTNFADKSKVRNTMAYEFLKRCGTAYHFAFPVRVQRNGLFWSVQDMVEDGDDRFLDRIGLDGDGALYKMYDRMENAWAATKKTRKEENNDDLATLISRAGKTLSFMALRCPCRLSLAL